MNLSMIKNVKLLYEIVFFSICFIAICFIYSGQKIITQNDGKGYDGVFYYKYAEQIRDNKVPIVGELPFINRIGNQFFIALYSKISGKDILGSALIVNLIGIFITVLLLTCWLRLFIAEFLIRWILIMLFMLSWNTPPRVLFYYPMLSDAWGAAWFMAGLLLLNHIRELHDNNKSIFFHVLLFSIIVAIGSKFRESNAILSLALFFLYNPFDGLISRLSCKGQSIISMYKITKDEIVQILIKKKVLFILSAPITTTIGFNFIISNYTVYSNNIFSYAINTLGVCYKKSIQMYLLGIFIAYGPIIILIFYKKYELLLRQQELFFILMSAFFFGFAGGSDTERIFFMTSFPIIFLMIGDSIKAILCTEKRWIFYIFLIIQSVSLRIYWNVPNAEILNVKYTPIPFFVLTGYNIKPLHLFSYHGDARINIILLVEYLFLSALFYFFAKSKK